LYDSSMNDKDNIMSYYSNSHSNSIIPEKTFYIKTGMDGQYSPNSYSEKEERTMFEEDKKVPWSFIKSSSPKNINNTNKNGYIHPHLNISTTEINTTSSSFTSDLEAKEKIEEELVFYSDETSHFDNGSKEWKDMHRYHQRELYKKEIKKGKLEKETKEEDNMKTRVKSTGSTSLRLLIESIERSKAVNSGKMKPCEDPAFYNMNTFQNKNTNYSPIRTPPGLKIKHKNSFNNNNNNNNSNNNNNTFNHPVNTNKTMNSYYNNHNNNNNRNNYYGNNGNKYEYNNFNYPMPSANQNQLNFMNLSYAMASNYFLVYQNNYSSEFFNGSMSNPLYNKMNLNFYNNSGNNGYYSPFNTTNNTNNHYNSNSMNYYGMVNNLSTFNPIQNYFPVAVGN